MPATADSVVVELLAKTDAYEARINGAATKSGAGFKRIESSAAQAEAQVERAARGMGSNVTRLAADVERGSARAANAQRNIGRQVSDFGTQVVGGGSPLLALAQQAPQLADALADTGGKAATVAAFFAGPWGAALLAAGSGVAILAQKALEGGETIASLTAKLEENAAKARLSAEAEAIFERSLFGAADASAKLNKQLQEQNRSHLQVAQSALAAAQAIRQQNLQNLRAETSRLALAQANARANANPLNFVGGSAPGLSAAAQSQAQQRSARELASATDRLSVARRGLAEAESAVVEASVPILKLQGAELADKSAAATGRHERAVNKLTDAYRSAQTAAAKLGGAAGNAARAAAVQTFRTGVAAADRTLAADQDALRDSKKKGPKGPSAEVLARRAEVARIRDVRNNEAYNNELEQLNGQIIAAQRERAVTAEDAARFERDAIESDFRKRRDGIAADLSAGKYDAAEAASLDQLNEYARLLRLRNVAIDEDVRTIREGAQRNALTLDLEREQLEADRSISESREEQRRIDLELVKIKYQQRKAALEALRAAAQVRGDTNAVNDATDQIDALPALERADRTGIDQRYRTRYENYRRGLTDTDRINDAIDAVKIDTLEKVTDELTEATKAALGLKGAFGDIVGELIRIGIQRKIIGPLADALFGKADGSSGSGKIGSAFQSIASLFGGRASGGYVGPRQTVRVNEGRGVGVELLRMGPQGGTVIPLGQTRAARPSGGTTVISAPRFDLKGAVITRELYADMERISAQSAAQARDQAVGIARKGFPSAQTRFSQLGTTG